MRFTQTELPGVISIALDAAEDERGSFARTYCGDEFAMAGITMQPRQMNVSHNVDAFTLRGMHYQAAPHGESKLVQCVRGRIYDVVVDLRPDSPSYMRWHGSELGPDLCCMIFVPEGCAHGFLTLEEDSDVFYVMGNRHAPEAARGVRWDDPAFGIAWPASPRVISPRDSGYRDFAA